LSQRRTLVRPRATDPSLRGASSREHAAGSRTGRGGRPRGESRRVRVAYRGPLTGADRVASVQAGQGRRGRWLLPDLPDPRRALRTADHQGARRPAQRVPPEPDRPGHGRAPEGPLRRHVVGPPDGSRAGQRTGHLQSRRLRRPDLTPDRVPGHACLRRDRHDHGRRRRVRRRLGGLVHQPADGHLPGVPAVGVRDRAGRRRARPGLRAAGQHAAGLAAGVHHRLLQLALHRAHHPRPDSVPA